MNRNDSWTACMCVCMHTFAYTCIHAYKYLLTVSQTCSFIFLSHTYTHALYMRINIYTRYPRFAVLPVYQTHACKHTCILTVSQICSFICLLSIVIILAPNSTPTKYVFMYVCMYVCMRYTEFNSYQVCIYVCMYVRMHAVYRIQLLPSMYLCMYVCTYACGILMTCIIQIKKHSHVCKTVLLYDTPII